MELETKDLLLRVVTKEDIDEVARMYEYPDGFLLKKQKRIDNMIENYRQNRSSYIKHLCF